LWRQRDGFSRFDINMAGIRVDGRSHRDNRRGPFGWKMPLG
jgi:hypothetical protein